ncbi:hypothetical protein C8R46DRAFT_1247807 [Mycena filopes]|nr:hypothetical protein C8R46DRAFT_1247807 [Mycena filopes]
MKPDGHLIVETFSGGGKFGCVTVWDISDILHKVYLHMSASVLSFILATLLAASYALPAPPPPAAGTRATTAESTQYHATCADNVTTIASQTAPNNHTLSLLSDRRWPNEFTWSGGFYLTPNEDNAVAFGAAFLPHCVPRGGVVVMSSSSLLVLVCNDDQPCLAEFDFDTTTSPPLRVNGLGVHFDVGRRATNFDSAQAKFGLAVRKYLLKGAPEEPLEANVGPPPSPEVIEVMREDAASPYMVDAGLWAAYDDLANYDVIVGSKKMTDDQQGYAHQAAEVGLPVPQSPFIQVVLVTERGK